MPRSSASSFGEPADLQAALSADGFACLVISPDGPFRARLIQIALNIVCLTVCQEEQPCCAFVKVPDDAVLIALPIGHGPWPVWSGMSMRSGELMTFGPRERLHVRSGGRCHWGMVRFSAQHLSQYGHALTGTQFDLPAVGRWRPSGAILRNLLSLHRAASRAAESKSGLLIDPVAAHGLEQQLIQALVECLAARPPELERSMQRRHRDLLARFEDMLSAEPALRIRDICTALGTSTSTLRSCAWERLGMSPGRYRRLRLTAALTPTDRGLGRSPFRVFTGVTAGPRFK